MKKKEKSYLILAIVFMAIGLIMIGLIPVLDFAGLTYCEIAVIFMLGAWVFAGKYRYLMWKRRELEKQDEVLTELGKLKQRL